MGATNSNDGVNRDVSAAKRAASSGPGTTIDLSRPSPGLLNAEASQRHSGEHELMGDILLRGQDADVDLDLPERRVEPVRDLDL